MGRVNPKTHVMVKVKTNKPDSRRLLSRIYGIDFSGAMDAGNKTWITSAVILGNSIQIEDCYQAKDLPDSAVERDQCLRSLWHFISTQKDCAFGLDFPFGVHRDLVKENSWEEFVLSFNGYDNPEQFRKDCRMAACGPEFKTKRETDIEAKTPWCVYNIRLYKQAYYGIRDVLAPLVRDQLAYVMPMQRELQGKPWLLEVCPASTLKRMGLYQPYKGRRRDEDKRISREYILKGIEKTGGIIIKSSTLRETIVDNPGGDAIDSVIAAFTTFRAISSLTDSSVSVTSNSMMEGYVYI